MAISRHMIKDTHNLLIAVALMLTVLLGALLGNPPLVHAEEGIYPQCSALPDSIWVERVVHWPGPPSPYYLQANLEAEYLPGVLIGEVAPGPGGIASWHDESLRALAIAARNWSSYFCHKHTLGNGELGLYDSSRAPYYDQEYWPENPNVSDADKIRYQQRVSDTEGIHMTYQLVIFDAQYRADNGNPTQSWEDVGTGYMYLKSVPDPVSIAPPMTGPGFSQIGSHRWASGTDPTPDDQYHPQWTTYAQILVHYYTGIHIRDAAGGYVTPNYRWNMLEHNTPANLIEGYRYPFTVTIQNTSTENWTEGNYSLGYRWCLEGGSCTDWVTVPLHPAPEPEGQAMLERGPAQVGEGTPTPEVGVMEASDGIPECDPSQPRWGPWPVEAGELAVAEFNVRVPQTSGTYRIEWDMLQEPNVWFRDQSPPWPIQSIENIEVYNSKKVTTVVTDTSWKQPSGADAVIPDLGPSEDRHDIEEAQFIWGDNFNTPYTSTLLTKEFRLRPGTWVGNAVLVADDGVTMTLDTDLNVIGNYDACFWPLPSLHPVQDPQPGWHVIRAYVYNRPAWAWFEARIELYRLGK